MMSDKVIFSGIKPSGEMTLGNYLGALRRFPDYQNQGQVFLCVVDLHAITVRQDPTELRARSRKIAAWYLACGIDPSKTTLFVQSHVPAHTQLAWVLNCYTQMGELSRQTQFKDKAQKGETAVSVGLFDYPVLMAADIVLYGSTHVPVGDDQKQHVELARDVVQRFNGLYGPTLVSPEPMIPLEGARIMDLQEPTKKMSKSESGLGCVDLLDSAAEIEKKFKRAVTDTVNKVALDKANQPGITNLLNIYAACTGRSLTAVAAEFADSSYGALKEAVAAAVVAELTPVQERFNALLAAPEKLDAILAAGADRANAVANACLAKVYDRVGFIPRGDHA